MVQRGVAVGEDMVTQLCLMGLLPSCSLTPAAALDVLERVVLRAAALASLDPAALQVRVDVARPPQRTVPIESSLQIGATSLIEAANLASLDPAAQVAASPEQPRLQP